jgi:hypothetical protein
LQMYLPRSMGGPEVPYLTAFQALLPRYSCCRSAQCWVPVTI